MAGICDALAHGLARIGEVTAAYEGRPLPRMADFGLWCEAALAPTFGPGAFMGAYMANRAAAAEEVVAGTTLAAAIRNLMDGHPGAPLEAWEGTPRRLYDALEAKATDQDKRAKDWPAGARGLGRRLNAAAGALRRVGILIDREETGARTITITRAPQTPEETPQTPQTPEVRHGKGFRPGVSAGVSEGQTPNAGETPGENSRRGNASGVSGVSGVSPGLCGGAPGEEAPLPRCATPDCGRAVRPPATLCTACEVEAAVKAEALARVEEATEAGADAAAYRAAKAGEITTRRHRLRSPHRRPRLPLVTPPRRPPCP